MCSVNMVRCLVTSFECDKLLQLSDATLDIIRMKWFIISSFFVCTVFAFCFLFCCFVVLYYDYNVFQTPLQGGDVNADGGESVDVVSASGHCEPILENVDCTGDETGDGAGTIGVVDISRLYVEIYIKRHPDVPEWSHFRTVTLARSN